MVGNRDWFFHLPLAVLNPLRQLIAERLGLANPPDQPFPHDIAENEELLLDDAPPQSDGPRTETCTTRFVRRGPRFEQPRRRHCHRAASIVSRPSWKPGWPKSCRRRRWWDLREIENVRPLVLVPVWIDGILDRSCPSPALRKRVKLLWDRLADEFLALDFVRRHDTWNPNAN